MAEKAGIDASEVVTEFEDENEVLKFLKKWGKRGREKFEELKKKKAEEMWQMPKKI